MNLLLQTNAQNLIRRRTLKQQIEMGAATLTFIIFALIAVISLIYLAHANRTATRGYILKTIEDQQNNLITEMEILKQQTSEAKSLTTIQNSQTVKNMTPVNEDQIIYLTRPQVD